MRKCADFAEQGRAALLARDSERFGRLMNENFETRRSIYQLPGSQIAMVEGARGVGASAKFAGSGGAIVGTYRDDAMFDALEKALGAISCRVLKPGILP